MKRKLFGHGGDGFGHVLLVILDVEATSWRNRQQRRTEAFQVIGFGSFGQARLALATLTQTSLTALRDWQI